MTCHHDKRFTLIGAKNGCCTCELEATATERDRLKKLLDRDHTGLAAGLNAVRQVVKGYGWIPADEWGSYEWQERTEKTLREEVGRCFEEAERLALEALRESGVRADAAFHPERDRIAELHADLTRERALTASLRAERDALDARFSRERSLTTSLSECLGRAAERQAKGENR